MPEHSPGPWEVYRKPEGAENTWIDGVTVFDDAYRTRIADVCILQERYKENAHLIAAAPEMLAVLGCVKDFMERWPNTMGLPVAHAVIAVIDKAEGKHVE